MKLTYATRRLYTILSFFLFVLSNMAYSQNCTSYPAFTTRLPGGNVKIKGDLTLIGNNIVSVNTGGSYSNPYSGTGQNNGQTMGYIDVDSDASTFSSSSAKLNLSNPACAKIKYAYLYWTAIYPYATGDASTISNADKNNVVGVGETTATAGSTRQPDWNQVKFKMPGSAAYLNLTADQVIWNGFLASDPNYFVTNGFGGCKDTPYICIKDVTSQLAGLSTLNGDYFVANVRAAVGTRSSGESAGWSLAIIYEDPAMPSKYISIFDGYQPMNSVSLKQVDINVSGFKTIPAGPVNVKVGVAALEGDLGNTGDSFSIKSNSKTTFTTISDAANPATDFFNSTVSVAGANNPNRVPNNVNTLGFDLDLVTLANPSNGVIANGDTSATLRLTTNGDGYGVYLATFAVDIIEPKINLTKRVYDIAGNDITGQPVVLGQTLDYKLSFQNVGNDDGASFKIRDILPINTGYTSVDVSGAPGTVFVYNTTTGQIDFTIPDALVKKGGASYNIKIRVKVASSCEDLKDACSNIIQNQAYGTYKGVVNSNQITDDPSILGADSCGFVSPGSSNFLADMGSCIFARTEVLCNGSILLKAANGYNTYTWYNSSNVVVGNTQSITVTSPGVYKVVTDSTTCSGKTETITVIPYSSGALNPIIPYADQTATCPNDGVQLPKIFLCGAADSRSLKISMSSVTSITWKKLNETSCPPVGNSDCANTNTACTWTTVGTGTNFNASTEGQYRVEIIYQNGCFERFYFNVFKNILDPKYTSKDIFCSTNGSINITNVPSGYEFQLVNQATNTVLVPYQATSIFPITVAGAYKVQIRQQNLPGGCVFTIPDIGIVDQIFQIKPIVTNKNCSSLGSIRIQASNGNPQYYYSISGTTSASQGPTATNDYTFANLIPGTYTVTVKNDDGCLLTQNNIVVGDDSNLKLAAAVSQNIGCKDGNIQMSASGGKVPYLYAVYSYNGVVVPQPIPAASYQTSVIFDVPIGMQGTYVYQVIDSNNCTALSNPVIISLVPDVVYTTTTQNVNCFGGTDGKFIYNVTSKNGYSVSFKLLDSTGAIIATNTSGVFSNLPKGDYTAVLVEAKGGSTCEFPQAFTITQPTTALTAGSEMVQAYTCTTTGTIQIVAGSINGGTAPYTYSINGTTFGNPSVFTGLTGGIYSITVKDANGCTFVTNPINFPSLNPPTDLVIASTAVTCPSLKSNVTISSVAAGNSPFIYEITAPAASAINNGNNNVFNNLAPGTYTFKVTDAKNCTYQENFTISPITQIAVSGTLTNNVKCLGDANGAVNFSVSGFTANYNYQINGGTSVTAQTNSTVSLTGLAAGNYTITVSDPATNCTATASVTVSAPSSALSIAKAVNPITCISQGSVTITAAGGWGGYQYKILQPNAAVLGPQSSGVFTNLSQSGNYTIEVTDANGCLKTDTFILVTPPTLSASISATSDFCSDGTNAATLVVSASGGQPAYEYKVNGGAWQSSNTFSNLTPGNYTVKVRDAYGCLVALPLQTIATQLNVNTVLTKDLDCTAPNATITGTISGGYSTFTYQVKINGGSYGTSATVTGTSFPYTASSAGTYQFLITDAKGCTAESGVITINPIVMPTATTTLTNVTCNGLNNASVTIVPNLGITPYTYSFNGSGYTSTATYNNLAAGTYSYSVKDSKSCLFNGTVNVTQPTTLVTTETVVPFSCSTSNTKQSATITITIPTTGTAPYQYSFNGGTSFTGSNILTVNDNGTNQSFTYVVKDANGCTTIPKTITLNKLNPPTDLNFSGAAITCTATTTTVAATAVNGVGALTYEIISPVASATSNTTGAFTGLLPNTYIFKVTDANGCYYTESYIITPVTPIVISEQKINDVLCKGANTGMAKYTVTGFSASGNYTITVTTSPVGLAFTQNVLADVITLSNLGAGTYTVSVKDNTTNCTAGKSITITEPATPLTATYTTVNANCFVSTSKVTVTAGGGMPGYTYAYKQDTVAPVAADYIAGNVANLDPATNLNWDVWVKDTNGCTFKFDVVIAKDPTPTVVASAVGQCLGSGTYTITATGTGLAPLTYSIDNGASYQSGNTLNASAPGNYAVTIKDKNGCTATSNTVIVAPQLTVTAVLDKDITCSSPATAQITLTATGGSPVFSYEYSSDGGTSFTSMGSNVFNTSTSGNYIFRVTDVKGCTAVTVNPIVINPAVNPVITTVTQTQSVLCNGNATAALNIVFDTTKGLAPFVINVNNTTTGTNYGTQTSGLKAGNYTITVMDAKGCIGTQNFIINEPAPLAYNLNVTPVTCGGTATVKGAIEITGITGGVTDYTYYLKRLNGAITGPVTNATHNNSDYTFGNLNFGNYTVTVIDQNGCTLKEDTAVASPPSNITINVVSSATCADGGIVNVTVGGSVLSAGPFYFAIYTGPGMVYSSGDPQWKPETAVGSKSAQFKNLIQGVYYSLVVFDSATGCYFYQTASTPTIVLSDLINVLIITPVTCKGSNDGTVQFTISNYTLAGYSSPTTQIKCTLYDAITNSPVPSVSPITLSGLTGTPVVDIFTGLSAGKYYIVFEKLTGDQTGCKSASNPFEIKESLIDLSVSASVSQKANCNSNSGIITATAKNGTAPYTYMLLSDTATPPTASTAGWNSANTFNANAGNYIVYAKDAYNCIRTKNVTLNKYTDPTVNLPASMCYVGGPFAISVTGTVDATIPGPKTYSVNGSTFQSSSSFTFNAAGTYNLVIKDGNGCTANVNYVVNPQLLLSAALTKNLDCTATPAADITLTATGGNNSYSYAYSTNGGSTFTPMASNVLTTSVTGNYILKVTDGKSCTATVNFTLDPVPPTVFTTSQTDVSCNGSNNGTITVNVTSGVGPYDYQLTDGVTTTPFQSSNVFSGLTAGINYVVTVRNAKFCTINSSAISVIQPAALTASSVLTTPLTCGTGNIAQPATVTVNGAQGTAPYQYSFDGGASYSSTNTYNSFTSATFNVYVKDSNSCVFILTNGVNIPALNPPTDLNFSAPAITCLATTTTVTAAAANGVGTLTYAIVFPTASATSNTTGIFAGLSPNTYSIKVTDAKGCAYQESYNVAPVTNIAVAGQLLNNVSCNTGTDGAVRFTVTNFAGTYSYSINGGTVNTGQNAPTINLTGLAAVAQNILVTDEITGCTTSASVPVSQPASVAISLISNTNANCNIGAKVSVNGSGGTPGYTYAFVQNGATPLASDYTAPNSAVLDPATNTDWDVFVKDKNGCTAKLDVTIAKDPVPTVSLPALASDQCTSAGAAYTFTATGTGVSPLTYSIGTGYQSSSAFTVASAGTYTITIKDGNGCTASSAPMTIYPPLNLTPAITALSTCANNDGVITVSASGGSGSYSYAINPYPLGIVLTGNVFSSVPSGSYTVTITDTSTTCEKSQPITLSAATPVTLGLPTINNVSCNGGSDGIITVNLPSGNDNPLYTYEITAPITVGPQNSNVFTGLSTGTYTVKVTSGRNCTASQSVPVSQPTVLTLSASAAPFVCNTNNQVQTTTITASASGGTTPYSYSIDGTNYFASNTFTVADSKITQNITVTVKDKNGCLATTPVTVNPLVYIASASVTKLLAITCTNDEKVNVNVTGGTGPFSYQSLPSGVPQGISGFNLTTPGTYVFRVTDTDTGCYADTVAYTVAPFNTISATLSTAQSVTCFGAADGAVSLNVSAYTGAYTYQVLDDSNAVIKSGAGNTGSPMTITGLASGNVKVLVTETASPFCNVQTNVTTVDSPVAALDLTASKTADVTCTNNQGEIVANATGGWGAYQFELVNTTTSTTIQSFGANNVFPGLSAGNYIVSVKDAKGCIKVSLPVILTPAIPISTATGAVASTGTLSCYGDTNAGITVSGVSGGSGSYQYSLNYYDASGSTIVFTSGAQLSNDFAGLGAGTYSITVSDSWSCDLITNKVKITEPTPVIGYLNLTSSLKCAAQAALTLSASGGTSPYQYSSDGTGYSSTTVYSVGPGVYQYYVKDANGCQAVLTNQITIDPVPALTVKPDLSAAVINCSGDSTAVIKSQAEGGLGSYQYTLLDASNNPIPGRGPQPSGTFSNLSAGDYYVAVKSVDCNAVSVKITIVEPPILQIVNPIIKTDVSCKGGSDGTITIKTTGGTGIVQFAISPNLNQFFSVGSFTNLVPGPYDVLVQDQAGCFTVVSVTIGEPTALSMVTTPNHQICADDPKGSIAVDINGGVGPYKADLYVVDNTQGTSAFLTTASGIVNTHTFSGLDSGDYYIEVYDANSCFLFDFASLNPPVDLSISAVDVAYNCTANVPGSTVTVTVNAASVGKVKYSIDGVTYQTSNIFTNLAAGSYTVYVKHNVNGCTKIQGITIDPKTPITASIGSIVNAACNGTATGSITVTASGGTTPLQYAISPGYVYQLGNVFNNLTAATYDIKVKDAIGCEVLLSNNIVTQPALVTVSLAGAAQELCSGDSNGSITVSISGGTTPYSTSIDGVTYTAGQMTYNNLVGGQTYTVYVKDANNCIPTTQFTYTLNPAVALQLSLTSSDQCTGNVPSHTIKAAINPSLNGAAVTYSIDGTNYQVGNTFPGLTSGTYTVWAKHTNGCIKSQTITIAPKTPITASIGSIVNAACNGTATGSITVTASGGTTPLQYAISPGYVYQLGNVFNNLTAATYDIKVKDAIGCEVLLSNNIVTQPAVVTVSLAGAAQELCSGDSNGSITVSISGGTIPYSTSIDGVTYTAGQMTYNNLVGGQTYTVYVKDANNCIPATQFTYTLNPPVALQLSLTSSDQCTGNVPSHTIKAAINPSLNSAAVTYSIDGTNYQVGNTFPGLTSGTYTVWAKHTNGCIKSQTIIIAPKSPITASIGSIVNAACNGTATGSITVTASGGTTPLQYSISPGYVYQLGNVFNNLTAATYDIKVKDAIGCEVLLSNNIVTQPAVVTVSLAGAAQELCSGDNNGSITVSISGGTTPYSTSIDGVTYTAGQMTYNNLVGGQTYTVYVKDANNCIPATQFTYTLNSPVDLQLSLTSSDQCTGNVPSHTIKAAINPSLNSAAVSYSIDGTNYQVGNTFPGLTSGTYTVWAKHTNGCIKSQTIIIAPKSPITASIGSIVNAACNGTATGSITVTASGGTTPLQYAISPGYVYQPGNVFNNLTAATYDVKVKDAIGCEVVLSNNIVTQPALVTVSLAGATQELCSGDSNGSITVNITGGTTPYSTSIDGVTYTAGQMTYNNLVGGQTYTVYVKDANNCIPTTQFTYTLNSPVALQLSLTSSDQCTGNVPSHTIKAGINPSLNSAAVTYSIDGTNYQVGNTFPGLTSGTYTVWAKHTNGCIKSQTITIAPKTPITAAIGSVVNATCNGTATGSITVTASGGTTPLQYAISPGYVYQPGNVFNLKAGTYDVKVRDAIGCEVLLSNNIITEPTAISVSLNSAIQELCSGDNGGSITINVSGGTTPYSTSIDGVTYNAGQMAYANLAGGLKYTVYVKDGNGCTPTTQFSYALNPSVNLQLSLAVSDQCTGNVPSHTITAGINPSLNGADVTYSIDGTNYLANNKFSGLVPGTYTVWAKHSNGCIRSQTLTINAKRPVAALVYNVVPVTCGGGTTGSIRVLASGGTPSLQAAISPDYVYQLNGIFNNLKAGTYDVKVKDAIGCEVILTNIIITEPLAVTVNSIVQPETCLGDKNGSIDLDISGGNAPYATSLDNLNYITGITAQYTFDKLTGGKAYTVYVSDKNNCLSQTTVTVPAPVVIKASVNPQYDCATNSTIANVQVDASVLNQVTYSLDGGVYQANNVFDNVLPGSHMVTVKHQNNYCVDDVAFTVEAVEPLTFSLSKTNINEFTATTQGGTGVYKYTLNDDYMGTQNVYTISKTGTYAVEVTDANGCSRKGSIMMKFEDIDFPNNFTPNDDGYHDNWAPVNTGTYPDLLVDIFDRYGRKVAKLRKDESWDGKYNGAHLPTGDYWYIVKLGGENDSNEYVGHFTLYR